MNKISSLDTIFVSLIKAAKKGENAQIELFDFFKKMTSGYGTNLSRVEYKGEELSNLISGFGEDLTNIKMRKPSIVINGLSRTKGQGIFGVKFIDGNKTIATSAIGADFTMGEPILQMKMALGSGKEKAFSFNGILNANFKGDEALHYNFTLNEEAAARMGMSKATIKDIAKIKEMAPEKLAGDSEALLNEVRALFANKGFTPATIDRCMPTLVEIASRKGDVNEKSARSALNLLLKHLGYNPKNVKLGFLSKFSNSAGMFDYKTGKLYLNIESLKDWQDFAVIMGHEATHMEDYIILYKSLGPEKFKKLIGIEKFNQAWYGKMSQFVSTKHLAFEHKGKVTAIVCEDGFRITDPKKIKEYLDCYQDTPRFNLSTFIKDHNRMKRIEKMNLEGQYWRMCKGNEYIISNIEGHARQTEINLVSEMNKAGIYHDTGLSREYGKAPGLRSTVYSTAFTKIDKALSKYGKKKCSKFNKLYDESLRAIDPELAELKTKIDRNLAQDIHTPEANALIAEYNKKVEYRYFSEEILQIEVMEKMQEKLGLPVVKYNDIPRYTPPTETLQGIDEKIVDAHRKDFEKVIENHYKEIERKLYLQAVTEVDPEIGEIQKALFEGRPKAEFQKLVKEKAELIKTRYGNASILEAKIHKEMKAIEVSDLT